ncbi:MAG: energy transducer TonB, partial [Saprospiraceae bacterium]|nr:energy transducer TonB [Saprospiraceae bacterium]
MRFLTSSIFFLLISWSLKGQGSIDTTVYQVADVPPYPLLKACTPELHAGWTTDSARLCGENQLFAILAQNIRYPEEARNNNLQGTVVISGIIEPASGRMSALKLLKDIGGGCGAEAIRVLRVLDSLGLRWQPGTLNGKAVRVQHALPIRFKLQAALPYYLNFDGDTIFNTLAQQA